LSAGWWGVARRRRIAPRSGRWQQHRPDLPLPRGSIVPCLWDRPAPSDRGGAAGKSRQGFARHPTPGSRPPVAGCRATAPRWPGRLSPVPGLRHPGGRVACHRLPRRQKTARGLTARRDLGPADRCPSAHRAASRRSA